MEAEQKCLCYFTFIDSYSSCTLYCSVFFFCLFVCLALSFQVDVRFSFKLLLRETDTTRIIRDFRTRPLKLEEGLEKKKKKKDVCCSR